MTSFHSSQTPVHVEYRNGTYYGQISSDYKRNGKGMLILDTSTVIFAEWRDNVIQGMYVYLAEGIRAYGSMVGGKADGYNIISTTSSYTGNGQTGQYANMLQQNSNIRTFYGTFRNQKIYGRCVCLDNDSMMVCQYSNNQMQQIQTRKSLRQRQLYDLLKDIFPNHLYTLEEYLTKFIKTYIAELDQLEQVARYEPCINFFTSQSDGKFYGFQEVSKPNKKFGIIMRDNQLISVGEHNNNLLQGIGRLYDREHILDGAFKNGRVEGIGIDYNRANNKFILQVHDGSEDRVQKGFGFPLRQILEFRKQFHLRSIFFYNDMAILNLKAKFQGLIGHIFVSPKRSTLQARDGRGNYRQSQNGRFTGGSRSPSKRIQNSPLRQKLSRYEQESDIIEDNSPIKNRPNEYRPIDRASGYFRDDLSQQRSNTYYREKQDQRFRDSEGLYSQTGTRSSFYNQDSNHNARRFNQTHQSNRSQERSDRYSQENNNKSRNKFQERQSRQKQTYNEILRQNPSSHYDQNHSRVTRTNSNYNPRQQQQYGYEQQGNVRGRKDTRDLVKELQNQQKGRRLALDQIYSKSNLYGRNKR